MMNGLWGTCRMLDNKLGGYFSRRRISRDIRAMVFVQLTKT